MDFSMISDQKIRTKTLYKSNDDKEYLLVINSVFCFVCNKKGEIPKIHIQVGLMEDELEQYGYRKVKEIL